MVLEVGQTKTLNKDVTFKSEVWAKKGERVKIISISGNAVIFERYNGKRFPCNIKDIK